jgi:hypothetical protein
MFMLVSEAEIPLAELPAHLMAPNRQGAQFQAIGNPLSPREDR